MGKELSILKELATISMTSAELASCCKLITDEICDQEFLQHFEALRSDIRNTYELIVKVFRPFAGLSDQSAFDKHFPKIHQNFCDQFNQNISIPRVNAELTYEKTLQFRKIKLVHTSYPTLKLAFTRLLEYIDKWHDNDIWLSMSIDLLMKTFRQELAEVSSAYAKDTETAFVIYHSVVRHFDAYLKIIENNLEAIAL